MDAQPGAGRDGTKTYPKEVYLFFWAGRNLRKDEPMEFNRNQNGTNKAADLEAFRKFSFWRFRAAQTG